MMKQLLKHRQRGSLLSVILSLLALEISVNSAASAQGSDTKRTPVGTPVLRTGLIAPDEPGYAPLTSTQRWDRFAKDYLANPFTYVAAAGAASGGFITHDPKDPAGDWGRNLGGYGRRVGTEFAIFTIHTGVHEAGDAALGFDPRYFPCRCSGVGPRTWNALKFSFVAYDNHGRVRFDLPQLAGAYGSTMISRSWYPDHYSPLVQGVQAGHVEMGFVFGLNLAREYTPEIKSIFRKLTPRKH